ncbi:general secretion pathway protein GspB [Shewanella sp. Scap07]|uniref:general secretion pathway protein GspB n=1 Tax=Shewanella sp. Scap07 TaxID=2589987 RepID=UPI0015B9C308|nr:general secretion pathway protein GspB [Shewanella sp. Scap07]QLE84539.1 general secretion pathway protein GspB [Shewanella sp. Scap07]
MSILLDAVTRSKQQQDGQIDPVMAPRAQSTLANERTLPWGKVALLTGAIALSIGGAWLFSQFFELKGNAAQSSKHQVQVESEKTPLTAPKPDSLAAEPALPTPQQSVRLAGKVALPVAQAYVANTPANQAYVPQSASAANAVDEPLRVGGESMSSQLNVSNSSRNTPSASDQTVTAEEPIILGANSNQRGQQLLDSLKYQVEAAANDVGFDETVNSARRQDNAQQTVSSDSQTAQPDNNLVAAFEAALLELERENSVATPVTEPKLDPIPATPSDELPRYGELPAGVQLQVPEFTILAHVYASDPNNRWLNVDGAELQQGDLIGGKMTIVEIRPRDVVLEVAGTEFKVPAI